ncbi:MAG: hypothetical protein AB7N80_03355 [Bdellovibrionales bacterium]
MNYQSWIKTVMTAGLVLAVVGCSDPFKRNSDPMKNFEELQNDVPPSQYKSSDQKFDGVLYDLQIDGKNDYATLEFYEGKEQSYQVQPQVFIPDLRVSLKDNNFPAGATLKANGKGGWVLKWTPALGTIPPGSQRQTFNGQIEFVLDKDSSRRASAHFDIERRNRIKNVTFSVNFANAQPKIEVGFNRKEVKIGEVYDFTVTVLDPNSSKERRPDVQVTFDRSNFTAEAKTFPASSAVYPNPDKREQFLGHGKWVFHFLFDTTTLPARYLKETVLKKYEGGEFAIYAINPSTKLESIRVPRRMKVLATEAQVTALGKTQAVTQGQKE